jgi:hypothetical protein
MELVRQTNGKLTLGLHPGQTQAWDSQARFTFVVAGTQSGKTSFGPWWLAREIDRAGDGDYLAVTATYDLFKLKMLPEMLRTFTGILGGWIWQASDRVLYKGESRIVLRSANAPGGLESATAKAAWLDECGQDEFSLSAWEAVQRRLSLSRGRVLGTTTPYNLGWLKKEVYDRWRAKDPDYRVIQFKSTMNPSFPMEEYRRAKATLPAWKFNMFYNGEFTKPAGMIYDCFEDEIHIVRPIPLPPEWPRYFGNDFGAVNNASVWIAENPNNNTFYLYRERKAGSLSTNEHVGAICELEEGEHIVARAGGAKSEQQQRWDWSAAGMSVQEPIVADVEAGIDRVYALIKAKRLFVFDTCAGVLDEIGTYSRELDDMGQPTEKIKDKETFHFLDALRYCVQHIGMTAEMVDDPFSDW